MAQELALSVHTINERLRSARRKLEVTSSKEAARLLLQEEGDAPQFLADESLGDEPGHGDAADQDFAKAGIGPAWKIGAILMLMTFTILTLAAVLPPENAGRDRPIPRAPANCRDSDASNSTRKTPRGNGSALSRREETGKGVDDATGSSISGSSTAAEICGRRFKLLEVRAPLGAVTTARAHRVRAPSRPADQGHWQVRFSTDFAERPDVIESGDAASARTVSCASLP